MNSQRGRAALQHSKRTVCYLASRRDFCRSSMRSPLGPRNLAVARIANHIENQSFPKYRIEV